MRRPPPLADQLRAAHARAGEAETRRGRLAQRLGFWPAFLMVFAAQEWLQRARGWGWWEAGVAGVAAGLALMALLRPAVGRILGWHARRRPAPPAI